jgi:hypothetical protein
MSYKIRNVAKQKLRGYHVKNAELRAQDEYILNQGIETSNKFEVLDIPATGMMSVDPVLTRISKKDVLIGKKRPMIMSINDLAEEEAKNRESGNEKGSNIHTLADLPPVQSSFRQFTGVRPTPSQNKGPKYEMKITLFNKGYERDMM